MRFHNCSSLPSFCWWIQPWMNMASCLAMRVWKWCTFAWSSDKPATPVLTADVSSPTDGDTIVLTCTTTSSGITSYQFFKGVTSLVSASSNQHTVSSAAIGSDDGSYTCVASIDTVASDASSAHVISCKWELAFNLFEDFHMSLHDNSEWDEIAFEMETWFYSLNMWLKWRAGTKYNFHSSKSQHGIAT